MAPLSALGPSWAEVSGFSGSFARECAAEWWQSDGPFVEYLRAPNAEQPPDLIVAIGAPAARLDIDDRNDITILRCGVSDHDAASPPRCYFRLAPARIGCISRATHSHASTGRVWSVPSANSY